MILFVLIFDLPGSPFQKPHQRRYTRFNDFVFGGSLFFGT
jgi:hypothetical protein